MLLTRRGFTLIELLMALVLMGIVSGAIYTLLINNQRLYRQQTQRIELSDNLRSASAILPADMRELNASDPLGSDILAMTASSIRYKAMRSLYTICQPPQPMPPNPAVAIQGNSLILSATTFGLRGLDAEYDSLLVFADFTGNIMGDDRWLHLDVQSVQMGNNCPNNTPSVTVQVSPPLALAQGVYGGGPVRGFEVVEVGSYLDFSGIPWLGLSRFSKLGGWSQMQPVVGPLQPNGFRLGYFTETGAATANPAQVRRIDITVVGRTSEPVRIGNTMDFLIDSLVTQVALRR